MLTQDEPANDLVSQWKSLFSLERGSTRSGNNEREQNHANLLPELAS